jgi:hypothetical protein
VRGIAELGSPSMIQRSLFPTIEVFTLFAVRITASTGLPVFQWNFAAWTTTAVVVVLFTGAIPVKCWNLWHDSTPCAFSARNGKGNSIRRLDQKGREVVRYFLTDPEKHPTGRQSTAPLRKQEAPRSKIAAGGWLLEISHDPSISQGIDICHHPLNKQNSLYIIDTNRQPLQVEGG